VVFTLRPKYLKQLHLLSQFAVVLCPAPDVGELPYPKKRFPEFSCPKSDDNTVLSGDDSNGWEKEEDQMVAPMAAKYLEEDSKAAATMED